MPVAGDEGVFGEMLSGVLVREDAGSGLVQPFVAAGVVKMPVSVDELFDGVRVDAREGLRDVWARGDDCRIDKEFSAGAGEDGDVSASA